MSKTVQEIMEVMGKTVEVTMKLERKNGSSYAHIADITPEDINEIRYYFDGALYRSVMRCLEVKLKGDWTAKAKKGLLLDSLKLTVTHPEGDRATISYGGFYIAEAPEYDAAQNLTSIIAYDELYLSMQPYTASLWQSGITVKNYLIAILNKLGINYDTNSLSLMANADKKITSEKFLDIENDSTEAAYTYRDIIDEIAKASGVTFAFKNSLGGDPFKLYAIKPTESGYVIDESNLRSVTIGAKYGPVMGVVLSREPQEDNVFYPSNLTDSQTAVKISNVEIMEDSGNDAYRETFIQGIYNNVKNTEYYLYDLDSFGIGFLNFGDIFTLKVCERTAGTIGDEKSYKTIFMRTDMTVGDGIKEKSKLEAPQATSTDYSAAESATDKKLKKAMLKVDKQNQRIESYITDNDKRYTKITQTLEGLDVAINDEESGLKAQMTATAEKAESAYSMASTVINAGYTTTDDVNTLISQSANDITLSVERNLKIGARNILLDSACFGSFKPTARTATLQVGGAIDPGVPSGKFKRIVFNPTATATAGFKFAATDIIGNAIGDIQRVKPNTKYALSWQMRYNDTGCVPGAISQSNILLVDSNNQGLAVAYDASRTSLPQVTTSWQKYIAVFTTPSTVSDFEMRFLFKNSARDDNDVGYIIDISSLKLEEGNIATDWTPSAEDVDQSVKAQISMCVQKDKDNKLTSAIAIEGNRISIKSDKFELTNDGEVTCKRVVKDNETGTETITKLKMTNATLTHVYQDKQIGEIGIGMDLSGLLYETITAGDMCGVMLKADSGNGYQIAVDSSTFNIVKNNTSANLTLVEDTGLGFMHKGGTFGIGMKEWGYGNILSAERMVMFSNCGMVIGSQYGLCLHGNEGIWLCGSIKLTDYYKSDTSNAKKPLYVNTTTGVIST